MDISTEADALNLFHFVGHTRYWEDNVTNGLLTTITRSPAGGLVLRELLDRCAATAKGAALDDFRKAISSLRRVDVRGQTPFSGDSEESKDLDFAVLVSLAPAAPEDAPSETSTENATGRFDAVLACRSKDCSFDLVLEAKLYQSVGSEQWNRYIENLEKTTGQPCVVAHMPWSDVVDVLDSLPSAAKADPIVKDYTEYLTRMYWLSGFRGFGKDDFFNDSVRDRRRTRLRQLAAAIVKVNADDCDGAVNYRELRGGLDIDLYVGDQLRLIGHTGLHSWQDDSLGIKLIVGSLNIQGNEDLWKVLKEGSEKDYPSYGTFQGTQALLRLDKSAVAECVARTARELENNLQASVIYRCWFHRFKDEFISSRSWNDLAGGDWNEVDAALRLGEPEDENRVSRESLDAISSSGFVEQSEAPRIEKIKADLESASQARQPSHHAILVLASDFDLAEFTLLDYPSQVEQTRKRHLILVRLLRELSDMVG